MFSTVSYRETIVTATFILSSVSAFNLDQSKILSFGRELVDCIVYNSVSNVSFIAWPLKVAFRSWDEKFTKNTKKSSLYSQSLLNFIHKTPVVERHPITREVRDLLRPGSTPTGNTVYFYMSSMFIYTLKIHRRSFKHSVRWRYYGK